MCIRSETTGLFCEAVPALRALRDTLFFQTIEDTIEVLPWNFPVSSGLHSPFFCWRLTSYTQKARTPGSSRSSTTLAKVLPKAWPYGALEGWNWPPRSSRYQRLLPPTSGRSQQIRAASFTPRPAGRRAFTGLRLLGSPHRFLSLRNCRYSQSLSTKKV